MDEEEQKNNGLLKQTGNALKEGAKKQAKQATKKIIKKVIMAILPYLIKIIAIVVCIVTIFSLFSWLLNLKASAEAKNADAFAVKYVNGSSASGDVAEKSLGNIIIDVNNRDETTGAYILNYEFYDENGNLYTETDAIAKIKNDIIKENETLSIGNFSDSELKIIGALMYNGLKVNRYNENELKALVIFTKADIASNNFDLRERDKIGTEVKIEDLQNNDFVYGTLQIHRTKAYSGSDNNQKLQFISYEQFSAMQQEKNGNITNYFSINEDGNVVFAKESSTTTTYTYYECTDGKNKKLSTNEIEQKIPEDNIYENKTEKNISIIPIDYKQNLSKYTVNYGLLSDLLTITDNVDFCLELAQLALNGKIVINVKEELTISDITKINTYTQTKLLYDYVDYEISGENENKEENWTEIKNGSGNPNNSDILKTTYGWDASCSSKVVEGNSYTGTKEYTWTYKNIDYKLERHYANYVDSAWVLYKKETETTKTPLASLGFSEKLIGLLEEDIKYEDTTITEKYTKQEKIIYKIEENSYSENKSCTYEISEVDSWYLKYQKENSNVKTERKSVVEPAISIEGTFSQELVEVLNTEDQNEINKNAEVKNYINDIVKKYKEEKSAVNVESKITKLVIKERTKIDQEEVYSSEKESYIKTYRFEENETETTEAQIKNIKYVNNSPTFTNEDSEEIGFLYIYDKYRKQGIDLFLENDAEDQLFELLDEDTSTSKYSNTLKYLLYVYDGLDRGVTEINVKIINLAGLNSVSGSSTSNYIKAWENSALYEYEKGQSSIFPTGYITEDGTCYIVYEDGSYGHNNIAYGICTFISSSTGKVERADFGKGYYNWKKEFSDKGISVETWNEGTEVDKTIVDSIYESILKENFIKPVNTYLKDNLSDYKFSKAQKNALVAIKYQYGNLGNFAEAYKASLNADGTLNPELIKRTFKVNGALVFNYTKTVNDRKYANWLLFTEETYIDRNGNKMPLASGNIIEAAYEVAEHYLSASQPVHYAGNSVTSETNATLNGIYLTPNNLLQEDWDLPIEQPEKYGIVCATFVSLAIWKAELIDAQTIQQFGYHGTGGIHNLLTDREGWEKIESYDELQAGDVVHMDGHVYIYLGDNKAIDQNYCVISSSGTNNRNCVIDINNNLNYKTKFIEGFRYVG